jgi:replicative DNA helicase
MANFTTEPRNKPQSLRSPGFRRLPHNVEIEKALLGAILLDDRRAFEMVGDFLKGEHFSRVDHGRIYEACRVIIDRGQTADPRTLAHYFEQEGALEEVGGANYLVELLASAITVLNSRQYAGIIYDAHLRRQLIALGEEVMSRAYESDPDESALQQIEFAEQQLYQMAVTGERESGFQSFKESTTKAIRVAEAAHRRAGDLVGVTTGLDDLDTLLGGLHRSDLIILAGRPGMGKTALATNIAFHAAYEELRNGGTKGAVVGFFSLEMSDEQLASRIVCEQAEIPSDRVRKGRLSNDEFTRLCAFTNELNKLPVFIDDTPALTMTSLRTRARRLKRSSGLGLLIIDYLQLIAPPAGQRYETRVQELSAITRGLKTLAKELDVPVIAISQLSRAVESREDKRPLLSDLRESGSIEQDADVVILLYREEYYRKHKQDEEPAGERNLAEAIVAKHRHGPTDVVRLRFIPEFTRFANRDPRDDPFA